MVFHMLLSMSKASTYSTISKLSFSPIRASGFRHLPPIMKMYLSLKWQTLNACLACSKFGSMIHFLL